AVRIPVNHRTGMYRPYQAVQGGNLLRFAIRDESVSLIDGKLEIGDLQFVSKDCYTGVPSSAWYGMVPGTERYA
ncbi:hypothetical protein BHM03_00059845, partial [Ensete ventricosum]